jgi:hypothetical protein
MAIGFFLDLPMETEKIFPICQRFATAIAARFLTIWHLARENQTVIKLLAKHTTHRAFLVNPPNCFPNQIRHG